MKDNPPKINKTVVGAILFAVLVLAYVWFFALRGTLTVTLADSSEIKSGAHFWLSNDHFKKEYSFPTTIRLASGNFTLNASGANSAIFETKFTIKAGERTNVQVKLVKNPENTLIGTSDTTNLPPYLALFPHDGGNYQITAKLNDQQTAISQLTITVYHQISVDQPDLYKQETSLITAAAKKWLAEQGVPSTIPVVTAE